MKTTMPLQNRVDPSGTIFATAARGTFLGNRGGAIHDEHRQIVRSYASRRWITCLLEFKGRKREVMTPGLYTELFFLDEAVALSAGHRPCAECRRTRFNAFRDAWIFDRPGLQRPKADAMDLELHAARIDRRRGKVTYRAVLGSLPDGCFVRLDGGSYLVWGNALLLWSPEGYSGRRECAPDAEVAILTPEPIVRCLRNGYRPEIHGSASYGEDDAGGGGDAADGGDDGKIAVG
jgi:hypothetical protein